MAANYRRGFRRAYVVLTVAWIAYWLVALPLQQMRGAARARDLLIQSCWGDRTDKTPPAECSEKMQQAYQKDTNILSADYFVRVYLLGRYSLLPFLAPAIIYLLLLGAAKAVSWVQRGFRAQ